MPSIAETAADLLANPRPVICLDTCELLRAVQCLAQGNIDDIAALFRLYSSFVTNPARVLIVVTELVAHEYGQNIGGVRTSASNFLTAVDDQRERIHRAWYNAGQPQATQPSNHAASALVVELANLAQDLLNAAAVLDSEPVCVDRAIARVRAKQRPSQTGQIKDSIHLEHYLELSRQLQNQGFHERRVFVSGNRKDFCQPRPSAHLHADLVAEFNAAALEYFSRLNAALGSLRI